MKKIITLLLILSVFATISISYAQERWHTLKTITGVGPQTTDYFEIPTDEWRIVWSHSELPYYWGWFRVNVYSEDEIGSQVGIIFSEGKETNGTLNIHEGKKKFYMVIEPLGVESYTLKVEYYEEKTAESSTTLYAALGLIFIIGIVVIPICILLKRKKKTQLIQKQ